LIFSIFILSHPVYLSVLPFRQNKDAGISLILYTMKRRYVKRFILFSYMWKKVKI